MSAFDPKRTSARVCFTVLIGNIRCKNYVWTSPTIRRTPLAQTKPKGFLTTRFLRADIFVLVGCWVDTYRPAILYGCHNRSGSASIRITKDRTPRILQGAVVDAATVLCSVAAACPLLAHSRHRLLHRTCPLLGVKRTLVRALHLSAFDP
jgi:hypothetical protein